MIFRNILINILTVVLLVPISTNAQESIFKGNVQTINGVGIENATILIKSNIDNDIYAFSYSGENGYYCIKYRGDLSNKVLLCTILGYKSQIIQISDSIFNYNFYLEEKATELKEVTIKGTLAVKIDKDTTEYNVKSFDHNPEMAIEELLKKLPGVSVSSNGDISFKGKPIEKILLDGSDLFESNYKTASKNISAKYVNKIQIIKNYQENKVLKNIEHSEKTVINLKFNDEIKKNALFGDVTSSGGYENKYGLLSSIFCFKNKVKFYDILNINNTFTLTSFDGSNNIEEESITNEKISNAQIINLQNQVYSVEERKIESNQKFNSFNIAFRPTSKIDILSTLNYNAENNSYRNSMSYNYHSNLLNYQENISLNKEPKKTFISSKLNYELSKNIFISYIFKTKIESTSFLNQIETTTLNQEELKNTNRILSNKLSISFALADSSAIVVEGVYYSNNNAQTYSFYDPLNTKTGINQHSYAENNIYNLSTEYINTNLDKVNFKLFIKQLFNSQQLLTKSNFLQQNNINNNIFSNSTQLLGLNVQLFNKITDFTFEINFENRKSRITKPMIKRNNIFVVSSYINFNWKINKNSTLTLNYSTNKDNIDINYFLLDTVYLNYRNSFIGSSDIICENNYMANLTYIYYNIFKNESLTINYFDNYTRNAYINSIYISSNINLNSIENLQNKVLRNLTLNAEKYIDPLRIRFKWFNSITQNNFDTKINSSINNLNIISFTSKLQIVPVFNLPLNLQFGVKYNYNYLNIKEISQNKNMNFSTNQDLTIGLSKKIKFKIYIDEIFTGNPIKSNILISPNLLFRLNNKLYFSIKTHNLLNIKYIEDYYINDYYSNYQNYSITPFQIIFNIKYSF